MRRTRHRALLAKFDRSRLPETRDKSSRHESRRETDARKSADVLPKKLFEPLGGKGPTAGVALTAGEFEHARDTYYRLAGCDPDTGYPTRARLADLGLEWVAEQIPAGR